MKELFRQSYRQNHEYGTKKRIFSSLIGHFISQLAIRFLEHKKTLSTIQNVIPKVIVNLNESQIDETVDIILSQWPNALRTSEVVCKKELLLWKRRWIDEEDKPCTFLGTLQYCNEDMYPNTYSFLKTGAVLPVTNASNERSFSTLKRIKPYLRNSTGENRLNGLAILSIHRSIQVKIGEVIQRFAQKNRKIAL